MSHRVEIEIASQHFVLMGHRGVYWPEKDMLFVADTHFGKEATFRRHGLPVPMGSTQGTLSIIERMLGQTRAKHLTILGDMFHARSSLATDVVTSLGSFFERFPDVSFRLIRGNHDERLGPLPTNWPLTIESPGQMVDQVALGHEPGPLPHSATLMLCGHVHPSFHYRTSREDLGKMPCFFLRQRCLVLPAIGKFTGTHSIRQRTGDEIWLVAGEEVFAIP